MAQSAFFRMQGTKHVSVGVLRMEIIGGLTGVDGIEEVGSLFLFLDIGIDEKGISLGMDVLHHDLEAVEASCFWDLDFAAESLDQVFVDNAVGGGEEGEHVGDEIFLVIVQPIIPVMQVFGKVNLFGGPK